VHGEVKSSMASWPLFYELTRIAVCDYSKFFGAKGAPPQQQTKLSFASKAKPEPKDEPVEGDGEGDVSAKENADPDKGWSTPSDNPIAGC